MSLVEGADDYTQDGTVDLRGNPARRSKLGGWTACSFVVVFQVFERVAYYGISSNLVLYLTSKLQEGTVQSANNVTNWVGTVRATAVLGAYLADAHLGCYWTLLLASAIYLTGMLGLTLAVSLPGLNPSHCSEANVDNCKKVSTLLLTVFYGALYMVAVGTSGTKPNISTIGADQFDDFDSKEKAHKLSFFKLRMFSIFVGTLFARTVLVYIQENVSWALGFLLPTLALAISVAIFLAGTPFYRHRVPAGSPFTRMAQVIVAAGRKWRVRVPSDPKELYEFDPPEYANKGKFKIDSTPTLRFLNKACVQTSSTSPWELCSVTQVEESKQMLWMIPILIVTFIPSCVVAQTNTLFVMQGTTLDRSTGSFKIPPASLAKFVTISKLVCVVAYDRIFVKIMQRWTKNPKGISLLHRMGIGLVLHIVIMTVASFADRWRLRVAREHNLVESEGQIPLTIFVLLPQFVLMGTANAFLEVAKTEFFYDQAPESMKTLGTSYLMITMAVGNFLSSFLLSTVSHITKRHAHHGWILDNLNASHLDYYYFFLAALNILNFAFFLSVAKLYAYRTKVSGLDGGARGGEERAGAAEGRGSAGDIALV
ncbi:hypothetical protein EUGRSUZ_H02984 [Eucalyptus grandis]|uniref:Uncharacterized protein n=2 Tax=Eucalyptus grandis TaxID=71139 RepID=A0ACC3JT69_EUCGR|nr:hypothetical protein EUGRSUZ_H02984 [Eucalyptus grandis]